ncbi:MAG: TonB-dependent receptor [Burkholderiales bacterium]|nr:TonB-dependent receptor [Burkholderiales bacterium]
MKKFQHGPRLTQALACGAIAGLFAQTALAQAAAQAAAPATQVAAATDSTDPEVIVVTARRKSERMIDVPVSATAVGPLEIKQYDMTSVANIRIAVPQITFDRGFTGSATSISMRGVSSSALDAGVEQSVLVDYDGMAISRGRIVNDALFDLQTIDVLKGPQAVYFGKNSPGGVVSVQSAAPTKEFSGYAKLGYEVTTNHNKSLEAAVSGPLNDQWRYRLAAYSSKSEGYIENMDPAGVADLVRTAATGSTFVPPMPAKLGAEKKQAGRLTLAYKGGDFDATFKLLGSNYTGQGLQSFSEVMGCPAGVTQPRTAGGKVVDPNGDCTLNNKSSQGWLSPAIIAPWSQVNVNDGGQPYSKNNTVMPVLTLNVTTDSFKLTSVTGYYDYQYVSQGNADATSYSYYWSYSNENNQSYYQELRAVSTFDGPVNFAAGGHYENNHRVLFVGGANGPAKQDPATGRYESGDNEQHNKSTAYSVFGQVIVKPSKAWELAAGGRYTSERKDLDTLNVYVNPAVAASYLAQGQHINASASENNFSPEATLSWHASRDVMLYGAYKTGYLSGGFSNPGTIGATTSVNTLKFDAEKVKGYELGAKGSLLDRTLTGSLTAYHYQYSGIPLTSLIALDATHITYVTQNAANTIAQGVELEGSFRPTGALTLRGSASYNDAHFASFAAAQCYTGQTAAQGCNTDPVTHGATQDLSGKAVYRSPKWIATAGGIYEQHLGGDLRLTWNADLRYSASYYAGLNLNPASFQPAYTSVNAGVRLSGPGDRWSFAVIGRNLGNRIYATLGVDKPGGTGEVFAVAGEPRTVVLQGEYRF